MRFLCRDNLSDDANYCDTCKFEADKSFASPVIQKESRDRIRFDKASPGKQDPGHENIERTDEDEESRFRFKRQLFSEQTVK